MVKKHILMLLIALSQLATSNAELEDSNPNILFLAIDDMNDWTGFLGGHPQALTPRMDELEKEG